MKSVIIQFFTAAFVLIQFSCSNNHKPNKLTEIKIGEPYNVQLTLNGYESYLGMYQPSNEEFDATLINSEDSNFRIPVKGIYTEGDNIYRNQEEFDKKQEEKFPIRLKGSSVLDEMVVDFKVMMPNDKNLIGKSFKLYIKDSLWRLYSDYPRASRPELYEKIAVYDFETPVKFVEKTE